MTINTNKEDNMEPIEKEELETAETAEGTELEDKGTESEDPKSDENQAPAAKSVDESSATTGAVEASAADATDTRLAKVGDDVIFRERINSELVELKATVTEVWFFDETEQLQMVNLSVELPSGTKDVRSSVRRKDESEHVYRWEFADEVTAPAEASE